MQRKFARAACAGVLATMALIAVLCVVDNEVALKEKTSKDLRGNALLKSQANTLNELRELKKKGKDMQSFDDMLHGFQHAPDNELTATLVSQAPKKSDVDVAIAPDSLGIVPFKKHLPTVGELNLAPEKKNKSPLAASLKLADDEYGFIQEYSEEWRPAGQAGLDMQIKSAKGDDEKEAIKADGLKGDSILGASGINMEEARDLLFVQMAASDDTGAEWTPKGQGTLNDQLKAAGQAEAEAKRKKTSNEDGLKGDSLMSAIGIKEKPKSGLAGFDDLVPEISADDLMLTQVSAKWAPQGQAGLSSAIKSASVTDEADAVKADGLGGADILSAAHPSEDTMFIQRPAEDKVLGWKPHGQKQMAGSHSMSQGGVHTFHKKKTSMKKKKTPKYMMPSDLDGDTILSAVSLGHHIKKQTDGLETMSTNFDALSLLKD